MEIGSLVKQYEASLQQPDNDSNKLLNAREVIELFPMFTQYGLDQAVKDNKIPVIKRGKLKFYDAKDIKSYFEKQKNFIFEAEETTRTGKRKYV